MGYQSAWHDLGKQLLGNQLLSVSIVNLFGATIALPTLVSPAGDITSTKPAYKWYPVSGATGYQIKITDTDTSAVVINRAVSTSACSKGVCSTIPSVTLNGVHYKLR